MAGATNDEFKMLLEQAETREASEPMMVPDSSGMPGAAKFAQHIDTSPLMCTETGNDTYSIVDNMPGENGLEE